MTIVLPLHFSQVFLCFFFQCVKFLYIRGKKRQKESNGFQSPQSRNLKLKLKLKSKSKSKSLPHFAPKFQILCKHSGVIISEIDLNLKWNQNWFDSVPFLTTKPSKSSTKKSKLGPNFRLWFFCFSSPSFLLLARCL